MRSLFIYLCFITPLFAIEKPEDDGLNILLLSSFGKEFPPSLEKGLDDVLGYTRGENHIHFEYLEHPKSLEEHMPVLTEYLTNKYEDVSFDFVVGWASRSHFYLMRNPDIFSGAQRIYIEFSEEDTGEASLAGNEIIIDISGDYHRTVKEIVRLQNPDKLMIVGSEKNVFSKYEIEEVKAALNSLPESLITEFIFDPSPESLAERLSKEDFGRSAVLILDGDGEYNGQIVYLNALVPISNVPLYTHWRDQLGTGVVGGRLVCDIILGQNLGNVILNPAQKERYINLSPTEYAYDWNAMKRWKIDTGRIPEGSFVLNKPTDIWALYKWYIISVFIVIIILSLLSVSLVFLLRSRNYAFKALNKEREILEFRVEERTSELVDARNKAEIANSAKSSFLANISHEIRTPMNAILGFSQVLARKVKDPILLNYIKEINRGGEILLSLINDVLDISKIEADKVELNLSPVNVGALFQEIHTFFAQEIERSGLDFQIETADDMPSYVLLDELRFRQVIMNIIGNAFKFTEKGYVHIKVGSEYLSHGKHRLVITIKDSGIGIPADQQRNIFEAFTQQKEQDSHKYGGTGLGLRIAQSLVELMGGSISLQSKKNQGSAFTITLNQVQVAQDPLKKSSKIDDQDVIFKEATILIAEDVQANHDLISAFLGGSNIRIQAAKNGKECVQMAKDIKPDLILMDIKMPEMDGRTAAQKIKNNQDLKHIPIVVVTAALDKSEEEPIKKLCDDLLTKPLNREKLYEALKKHLTYETKTLTSDSSERSMLSGDTNRSNDTGHFSELAAILENEILPQWERRYSLAVNKSEVLINRLIELGKLHQYRPLSEWAHRLQESLKLFDMDEFDKLMDQFPQMLEKTKSLNYANSDKENIS